MSKRAVSALCRLSARKAKSHVVFAYLVRSESEQGDGFPSRASCSTKIRLATPRELAKCLCDPGKSKAATEAFQAGSVEFG